MHFHAFARQSRYAPLRSNEIILRVTKQGFLRIGDKKGDGLLGSTPGGIDSAGLSS
jgi:hypothetical protein